VATKYKKEVREIGEGKKENSVKKRKMKEGGKGSVFGVNDLEMWLVRKLQTPNSNQCSTVMGPEIC